MHGIKRVLITGPALENVGGISVHVRRLVSLLRGRCEFDFVDESRNQREGYFNLRSLDFITYFKKIKRAHVVHINSGSKWLRMFNAIVCRVMGKYTVVTVHRDPERESHLWLTRCILSLSNVVIAVNAKGVDLLRQGSKCEYIHLPAYLPPNLDNEPYLSENIQAWITHARETPNSVVMVNNASALVFNNGEDLYGLDLCLAAMKQLCQSSDKYYLLFVVVKNDNPAVMDGYKQFIVHNNLSQHVLLIEDSCSFVRLIAASDIVLRTTNTDGDSLTVREGLSLGVPVIASDCVERPAGTTLFHNRDAAHLAQVIASTPIIASCEQQPDARDYTATYSKIYQL